MTANETQKICIPQAGERIDILLGGTDPAELEQLAAEFAAENVLRRPDFIRLTNVPAECLTEELRARALESRIDLIALAPGLSLRDFRVACFDMDSTLIQNECIDDMAAIVGRGREVAEMTRLAMEGHLPFAENLRRRVRCLVGADGTIFEKTIAGLKPTPFAAEWIAMLNENGIRTYILTGGFAEIARVVAERYGMTGFVSNRLGLNADGSLSGEVTGPAGGKILDADGKRRAVEVLAEAADAPLSAVICGGDGANDLEMIGAAGFGFAYHGKPVVAAAARHAVRFGDFRTVAHCFVEAWPELSEGTCACAAPSSN